MQFSRLREASAGLGAPAHRSQSLTSLTNIRFACEAEVPRRVLLGDRGVHVWSSVRYVGLLVLVRMLLHVSQGCVGHVQIHLLSVPNNWIFSGTSIKRCGTCLDFFVFRNVVGPVQHYNSTLKITLAYRVSKK